jgi:hypothetical protein
MKRLLQNGQPFQPSCKSDFRFWTKSILPILLLAMSGRSFAEEGKTVISAASKDANGFLVHEVRSPYQAGTTRIRLLLPERMEAGRKYPVVYVLPVEPGEQTRFGDGLLEVKKEDLQNKHRAIFVEPTFSHLPWYADHPSDPAIRQETYLLKVVIPFVEKTYPAKEDALGRLLLGFSKSGWGAFSLLLRHSDLFGRAAAWDAPLMMHHPDHYGMGEIFATQENFDHYEVSKLLDKQANLLHQGKRLILIGYGNFRSEHQEAHTLMLKLGIDHVYVDGPERKHTWGSGWVPQAVQALLENDLH